jgi:hypothetical protein
MFLRKIINFIKSILNAFKDRPQAENIKPARVMVKAPTMPGIKYGLPKIIPKK